MLLRFHYQLSGPEGRFRVRHFELAEEPAYCCRRMDDEWGSLIGLGVDGTPRAENIRATIQVHHYHADDSVAVNGIPITHCPWCGVPIELANDGLVIDPII